jgi:hypothetical protein
VRLDLLVKIRKSLLKDPVLVKTYEGESAYGPTHADEVTVKVHVDVSTRLVRSSSGDEVVASTTLYAHPDDADRFTEESQVTVRGRPTQVVAVGVSSVRGKPTHAVVSLA